MKYIFLLVKKMSRRNLYKFFMESLVEIKSIENLRVLNIGAGGPIQGIIELSLNTKKGKSTKVSLNWLKFIFMFI